MPAPYPFGPILAADPSNTENVAKGGEILIYAPGDSSKTPLALTDLSLGMALPNPLPVNNNGFGPAFLASLDQVAWEGGGFTGTYESYRGMKDEAETSRQAAEDAQVASEYAAAMVVAPTADVVDAVLSDPGSSASLTVAAIAGEAVNAAVEPVATELANKASLDQVATTVATAVEPLALKPTDGGRAVGQTEMAASTGKSYRTKKVPANGAMPAYYITTMYNATSTQSAILHVNAHDNLSPVVTDGETLSSFSNRTGANILINAGGWWTDHRRMGLSVHNGVLIQDWDYGQPNLGVQGIAFYRDGTIKCVDSSVPGAELVAQGVWAATCQGKAAIKNGIDQGLASDPYYTNYVSGRQAIGVGVDGVAYIFTFPGKSSVSGPTIAQVLGAFTPYNLKEMYMLDGGGSTQLIENGNYLVPSSDAGGERALGDCLAFYGYKADAPTDTGWLPIPLAPGYTSTAGQGTLPMYRRRGENLYLRGSVSGTFGTASTIIGTIPAFGASAQYISLASGPGVVVGKIVATSPTGTIAIFGPSTGLTYVRLDGCNWVLVPD